MICSHCKRQINSVQTICPFCEERLFVVTDQRSSEIYGVMPEKKKPAGPKEGDDPESIPPAGPVGGKVENADNPANTPPVDSVDGKTKNVDDQAVIVHERSIGSFHELILKEAELKMPVVRKSRRLVASMAESKAGGRGASLRPPGKKKTSEKEAPDKAASIRGDSKAVRGDKVNDQNETSAGKGKAGSRSRRGSAARHLYEAFETPEMVKRHEYVAITPISHSAQSFNWMRLCLIAFICVTMITVGVYLLLTRHPSGQYWLAGMGRDASMEAYHELGRQKMISGSITGAIRALEIAQSKSPDNFEVLLDLGMAYKGNNQVREAELAYTRAAQVSPNHPEPYRYLIQILQEEGRSSEALELIKYAIDKTGADYFQTLYSQLVPKPPTAVTMDGPRQKELDIPIQAEEGAAVYYTTDDSNPKEFGALYVPRIVEGKDIGIHLEEGTWRVRAVAYMDGMYSEEMVRTYIINKPIPDMPKATLKQGKYDSVKSVSIRGPKDSTIYYTVDGSMPTIHSRVFSSDQPIQLRIGKTTVKAIAVNVEGKISNMMEYTYECGGRTKRSMEAEDTVDGLVLHKTTKEQFIQKYGSPLSEKPDGEDKSGSYIKLTYSFGYAVFLTRKSADTAILAELSTSSSAFKGPRGTKVGVRMENVIDAFRDDGGEENSRGGRDLYRKTDGHLGFIILDEEEPGASEYEPYGLLSDGGGYPNCKVSYYLEVKSKQFIELTYHVRNGIVERMEWLRYEVP